MTLSEILNLLRFGYGALLAITLPPAILYWFVIHPFVGFWRRVGLKVSFWAMFGFFVLSIAALYPFHRALLGRDLGNNLATALVGLVLVGVATIIQKKRKKYLTNQVLMGIPELAPETRSVGLLQEGIYGVIRHPRYVEFAIGMAGTALIVNFRGFYVEVAAVILSLLPIVWVEERELRDRFGAEYDAYRARVPAFFPRPRSKRMR